MDSSAIVIETQGGLALPRASIAILHDDFRKIDPCPCEIHVLQPSIRRILSDACYSDNTPGERLSEEGRPQKLRPEKLGKKLFSLWCEIRCEALTIERPRVFLQSFLEDSSPFRTRSTHVLQQGGQGVPSPLDDLGV